MQQGFGRVLRAPYVPWLAAASVFARLPYGVDALAVLLYVQDLTGSFATGGLVSAANATVAAISSPLLGRAVDRIGQTPVLVATALLHALGLTLMLVAGESGAPIGVLAACAVLAGLYPPMSPCLRNLWGGLLDRDERAVRTALALDAILLELVFIGGPLLAAVVFAVWSPGAAIAVATVLATSGTLAFAAAPPSRAWRGDPARRPGLLGALASPGLRTMMLVAIPQGVAFGAIDVALPAYGVEQGSRSIGGVAIACFALGSAVGGVLYGIRAPTRVLRSYLTLIAVLPFGLALLALAGPTATLLALAPVAGAIIAPLTAAENELMGLVAPAGTVTEAYAWFITAVAAGIAIGAASAGAVVESSGWRSAILLAAGVSLAGAVAGIGRRRTLVAFRTPA